MKLELGIAQDQYSKFFSFSGLLYILPPSIVSSTYSTLFLMGMSGARLSRCVSMTPPKRYGEQVRPNTTF